MKTSTTANGAGGGASSTELQGYDIIAAAAMWWWKEVTFYMLTELVLLKSVLPGTRSRTQYLVYTKYLVLYSTGIWPHDSDCCTGQESCSTSTGTAVVTEVYF